MGELINMRMWSLPPIQGFYGRPIPGATAESEWRRGGQVVGKGDRLRFEVMEPWGGDFWEMPPCPHEGCTETLRIRRVPFMAGGAPSTACERHGNADMITFLVEDLSIWTVALAVSV